MGARGRFGHGCDQSWSTVYEIFGEHAGGRFKGQGGSDIQLRLAQLDDPSSEMSQLWNQQHDFRVAQQLLRQVEAEFTVQTWAAFTRLAIDGQRAGDVAAELGISTNAVFVAKSRVLSRSRRKAAGLIDSDLGGAGNVVKEI